MFNKSLFIVLLLLSSSTIAQKIYRDKNQFSAQPSKYNGGMASMRLEVTTLEHTPQKNIEDSVKSVVISVKIKSDTSLVANSSKVVFIENDTTFTKSKEALFERVGTSDEYQAIIPISDSKVNINYYISITDSFGITVKSPTDAPKNYWSFSVGVKDTLPPVVEHYPANIVASTSKQYILAHIEDTYSGGIDSAYVEYSLNGQAKPTFGLKKYNPLTDDASFSQGKKDEIAYLATNIFAGLKVGDRIKYRIIATDKSKAKNKTIFPTYYVEVSDENGKPTADYFEILVADVTKTAVNQYVNNFNTATSDFALLGFTIGQATNFTSGGLHSIHPYTNGKGTDFESSIYAQLLTPIKLSPDSSIIRYDEVVLVEPGDDGTIFGDKHFYDYVIVEASKDNGITWIPLEDGYDSKINAENAKTFSSLGVAGPLGFQDSRAVGKQTLMNKHTINVYSNKYGKFSAGDEILIRFRLFADIVTNGWGWAIDNLEIQAPPTPTVLSVAPEQITETSVYPNPSNEYLQIKTLLDKPQNVHLVVSNLLGKNVFEKNMNANEQQFNYKLNIQDFDTGTYFIKIQTESGIITKKFVVNH